MSLFRTRFPQPLLKRFARAPYLVVKLFPFTFSIFIIILLACSVLKLVLSKVHTSKSRLHLNSFYEGFWTICQVHAGRRARARAAHGPPADHQAGPFLPPPASDNRIPSHCPYSRHALIIARDYAAEVRSCGRGAAAARAGASRCTTRLESRRCCAARRTPPRAAS